MSPVLVVLALNLASSLATLRVAEPQPAGDAEVAASEAEVRQLLEARNIPQALPAADRLVARVQQVYKETDSRRWDALELAASVYRASYRVSMAADLMDKVAAVRLDAWTAGRRAADPEPILRSLQQAGYDLESIGLFAQAAARYERALEIQDLLKITGGRIRVRLLWSLGRLLAARGDIEAGTARLIAAEQAAERLPPAERDPRSLALIRYSRGLIALGRRDLSTAWKLLKEAGQYYDAKAQDQAQPMSKEEGNEFMLILLAEGMLVRQGGKPEVAEAFYQTMLVKMKHLLDPALETLFRDELARTKLTLGKTAEAEQQLTVAVGLRNPARPDWRPPPSVSTLLALVRGIGLDRPNEDLAGLREIIDGQLRSLTLGFGYQTDRQRLVTFSNVRPCLDVYLTLALKAGVPSREIYEMVSAWKGAVFTRSVSEAATASGTSEVHRRLDALRHQIADTAADYRWMVSSPPDRAESHADREKRLRELAVRQERLGQEFAEETTKLLGPDRVRPRVAPAEIAAALPPGVALVDYLVYTHYLPLPPGSPPTVAGGHYRPERRVLAFVVRPNKEVVCIPLDRKAEEVEGLIDEWQRLLPLWNDPGTGPKPELRAKAEALAAAIWVPLTPHLQGVTGLVLSPDGLLWRFPFAALPTNRPGRYLIQDYPIAHALSGRHAREMFRDRIRTSRQADGVLIVGNLFPQCPTSSACAFPLFRLTLDGQPVHRFPRWRSKPIPSSMIRRIDPMLFKTIVLDLLQDQYPQLHHRLRLSRTLLAEIDRYAIELRSTYLEWIAQGMDASAARELAVEQLQDTLAQDSARLEV